ncbi:MAG: hypothetical protein EYC70_12005 [Planctomycetota bacterium]|nr:MAG: hypothetical protein EYC70_12005 [Planctomycetota bacterium]
MRLPAVLALILSASLAFGQGGTMSLAETVQLPSSGPGDADHGTVAINEDGDIFVTWSTARTDLTANAAQVEGVYLRYLGGATWELPALGYNYWVLGAADAVALGGGYESCRKPDVVAVGKDFVVTWPRSNETRTVTQLEIVRVLTDAALPPTIDAPGAGIGFVVDADFDSADAGGMPDLATFSVNPPIVGVAYVHDRKINAPYRDFDIRFARVEFGAIGAPAVEGPMILVRNSPFDDAPNSGEPAGGKVLPDLEPDDGGNMVLAIEAYARYGHHGAPTNEGRIYVQWYGNAASGVPALLSDNEVDFSNTNHFFVRGRRVNDRTRRPNLAGSRLDGANSVSLAFLDAPDSTGDIDTEHRELFWDGADITMTDFVFPNLGNKNDNVPVPIHGSSLRACLAVREDTTEDQLKAFIPSVPTTPFRSLKSPVSHPWRPAVDLMEPAPADITNGDLLLPVTYEGPGIGVTGLRIFLVVHKR